MMRLALCIYLSIVHNPLTTLGTNCPVVVSYLVVTIGLLVLVINVILPTTVFVLSEYGITTVRLLTSAAVSHIAAFA